MAYVRTRTFVHEPVELGYDNLQTIEGKARLYITPEGDKFPSVTTVLGFKTKGDIQAWRDRVGAAEADRIARHACTRGNALHNLAEKYLNNEDEVIKESDMPHVKLSFSVAQKVLDKHIGKIVLQECPLYSRHLRLAGRVDLVAEFDGHLSIVDFKTSSRVKTEEDIENYFMQESGYAIMFEERTGIPITRLVTIMVVDGQTTPLIFKQHRDKWAPKLIEVIAEYEKAKLFGHI